MPRNSAIRLIEQGVSVIPIGPNKRPLVAWEQFQRRIADEEEVDAWFEMWPDANIGIVTGALSGITVVDTDNEDADEWWRANGQPSTLMVKTGKGRHYYYRHGGERNAAGWKGVAGLDVRGEGGYVVAPPSLHPSGARYEFIGIVEFDELPPLLTIGRDAELFDSGSSLPSLKGIDVEGQRVADKLGDGPKLKDGDGRNQVMTEYVGELVARGLSDSEVIVLAEAFQSAHFAEELDHKELATIVRSIRNTDKRKHPEKYDPNTGAVSTITYEDGTTLPSRIPGMVTATALAAMELPVREYMAEPFLTKPSIAQIYGPAGHGKTMFSLGAAISMASGTDFGPFRIRRPVKVLYVDADMGAHDQQKRLYDFKTMLSVDPGDNFSLISTALMGNASYDLDIRKPDGLKRLIHAIMVSGAEVVFLDNIRTICIGMKESASEEWSVINAALIALRNTGVSVVYLHHSNKATRDQTGRVHAGTEAGSGNQLTPLEIQLSISRVDPGAEQYDRFLADMDAYGGGYLRHVLCVDYGKVRDRDSALHTTQYIGFGVDFSGAPRLLHTQSNRQRAIRGHELGYPLHEIATTLMVDKVTLDRWIKEGA